MGTGFDLKSPAALVPNKRVTLSFEDVKQGIDFFSLTMKVLAGFFQCKTFIYFEKSLLFHVVIFMDYLS